MTLEQTKEAVKNATQQYYNREQILELLNRIKEPAKKTLTLFDETLQGL
jgi:hypothetical protein